MKRHTRTVKLLGIAPGFILFLLLSCELRNQLNIVDTTKTGVPISSGLSPESTPWPWTAAWKLDFFQLGMAWWISSKLCKLSQDSGNTLDNPWGEPSFISARLLCGEDRRRWIQTGAEYGISWSTDSWLRQDGVAKHPKLSNQPPKNWWLKWNASTLVEPKPNGSWIRSSSLVTKTEDSGARLRERYGVARLVLPWRLYLGHLSGPQGRITGLVPLGLDKTKQEKTYLQRSSSSLFHFHILILGTILIWEASHRCPAFGLPLDSRCSTQVWTISICSIACLTSKYSISIEPQNSHDVNDSTVAKPQHHGLGGTSSTSNPLTEAACAAGKRFLERTWLKLTGFSARNHFLWFNGWYVPIRRNHKKHHNIFMTGLPTCRYLRFLPSRTTRSFPWCATLSSCAVTFSCRELHGVRPATWVIWPTKIRSASIPTAA